MENSQLTLSRSHLREIAWMVIAQAGAPLASIASIKLLTTLLIPGDYGTVAIVTSYVLAAFSVAMVPMSGSGATLFHQWAKAGRTIEFLGTLLAFNSIPVGLITIGLIVVASVQELRGLPLINAAILYGALLLCAEVIKGPVVILTNVARLRRLYALLSLLDGWGKLVLALLAIILAGSGFQPVLAAYALSSAIVAFVAWYALFSSSYGSISSGRPPLFSVELLSSMLKSGWSFYLIGVANWVISVSDRALLGALVPVHDVGIYTASCQIASIPPMALYSFAVALIYPIIYQRHSWRPDQAAALIGQSLGYLLWLLAPLTLVVILEKERLLNLFAGRDYEAGAAVILWVAPAFALNTLITITALPFWLERRGATYLRIIAGAAACNILLNLIFIPARGFVAAAVSTLAAYLILFVASVAAGRRVIKWTIPPAPLWATGAGIAAAGIAFMLVGKDTSLARIGLFALIYFSSSITLLLLMDETPRVMIRSAASRLTAWGKA